MSQFEFLGPAHIVAICVFRNRIAYEIAWFWGIAGRTNALVTPQLEVGFPEYRFFQYFIAHGGIVAGAFSRGMFPDR